MGFSILGSRSITLVSRIESAILDGGDGKGEAETGELIDLLIATGIIGFVGD